jgi:hypothetical protein
MVDCRAELDVRRGNNGRRRDRHCARSVRLPRLRPPVAAADQPVADRAGSVDHAGDPPEGLNPPDPLCRLLPDVPPRPGRGEGAPGQDQRHDPAGVAFYG